MHAVWRRWVIWGVLGAALAAGVIYAFWPQPIPVDLATVVRGPLVVTVNEEGETRIRDVFVLSAPVAGRVRRIEAEVGDNVVAEQTVVAEIEPADPAFLDLRSEAVAEAALRVVEANKALAEAQLAEAEAEFEFASSELRRARRLFGTEMISQSALDDAERRYKTAQAAVATARAGLQVHLFELERARAQLVSPVQTQQAHGACACVPLLAPVDGKILRVVRESEGVVEAGDALIEIGDPTDLEIVVDFLSSDAVKIGPGQRVIIEEWGGDKALSGRVRLVEPFGFTKISALGIEEQRTNVIIDLTSPLGEWQRLGHGYQVEVRVVLWEGTEVLKLPLTALFRHGGEWAVFVEKQAHARLRTVKIGRRTGLEAEIVAGVSSGDRVIVSPSDRITDGVRIRPRA
ncbi:MAG: HlyD family efflux transporter periplasmic adaptor subunit [Gammaproteobacteria bacterium]|nr:HlyD family efflux transporter periplasmic adaptor subunit [Gammaproteobacteria bacterium]NIR88932.1 HlyD family efflux transporter periplasmic adaptor subunit [Gammaproteobacteria bacterium]NIU05221.1 HlyD family efflux transporter periplasmic adaptor subunit [Gammaproteobacteria bacterium]NIV52836.1 HlyD family efflux transporter periplasmic adaptor subunit [Gammaproteobacteria bacterium]NIW85132.1 HlyD family efflux transporter periplasmic adaptor subunit [Gammaproteobacteria bacterium]